MTKLLTDSLLIANPALSEIPKFEAIAGKAVYLVEHSKAGAVGVALNQNYSKSLEALAVNLPALGLLSPEELITEKVMAGGPVMDDRPWLLGRNTRRYKGTFNNGSLSLHLASVSGQCG